MNTDDYLLISKKVNNIKFIINMNYHNKIIERFIKIYRDNFTLGTKLILIKVKINNKKSEIKKLKHLFNLNVEKYIIKVSNKLKNYQ